MKLSVVVKQLLPGVALLLAATTAFAANKASFKLSEPVTVSGHQLAAGQYDCKWDGTGSSVDLSILSDGKLVVTVPARVIEQSRAGDKNTMKMRENNDGTRSLTQIYFAGKKYAFAIGDDSAAAGSLMQTNGTPATSK